MSLALFNLLFVVVAVLARPSPGQLATALATPLPTGNFQEFLLILASNIGATVTPWMLFFQQSASVDKGLTPKDIPQGRLDTVIGTVLAVLAGCAALVAASTLFDHHVDTSAFQAGAGYAEALRPLIGAPGAAIFRDWAERGGGRRRSDDLRQHSLCGRRGAGRRRGACRSFRAVAAEVEGLGEPAGRRGGDRDRGCPGPVRPCA